MSNTSLLPPNATPQEIAIAETISRVSDVPVLVRESWSPDNCPTQLLPWLAWAHSVDEWDPAWSDSEKRQVIRNSLFVHQHKGTTGAVKRALASTGFASKLIEWFQDSPVAEPYTFRAEIDAENKPVEEGLYAKLERLINSSKNVRSQLSAIRIRGVVRGKLTLASACVCGEEAVVYPYFAGSAGVDGVLRILSACTAIEYCTVYPASYSAAGAFINSAGELMTNGLLYSNAELLM